MNDVYRSDVDKTEQIFWTFHDLANLLELATGGRKWEHYRVELRQASPAIEDGYTIPPEYTTNDIVEHLLGQVGETFSFREGMTAHERDADGNVVDTTDWLWYCGSATLQCVNVPQPHTILLRCLGLAGISYQRRRKLSSS